MLLERRQARWLIAWRPLAAAAGPSCHEFWGALPPHPHPQLPEIVMFGCVNNPPSHNVHVLHVRMAKQPLYRCPICRSLTQVAHHFPYTLHSPSAHVFA
jgi:hypothetical protein